MSDILSDLARHMFDMQADDYEADEAMRELAWADPFIRDFWRDQAEGILEFFYSRGVLS